MRKILSVLAGLAVAAGLSVATAPPASAAEYCFGPPSQPLAFVCVQMSDPTVPNPQVTWVTFPVTVVPSVCYGVGCTSPTTVYATYPVVSGVGMPTSVTIHWNGYTLPDDLGPVINDVIDSVFPICLAKPPICI